MTKDEIIDKMCSVGIIVEIADEYHLTERYKELLEGEGKRVIMPVIPKTPTKLDYAELLNAETNGQDWPVEVLEAKGRTRAGALMDVCNIPSMSSGGYRLKGLDKDAVNIIGNIVDSPNIDPRTFIEAIQMYYKHTERPKAFKNLIKEGDALDMYNEHIEGSLKPNLVPPNDSNESWH